MIAKINTSNKLFGALLYNMQKVEDGEAFVMGVNGIWENADGRYTMRDLLPAFDNRLAVNKRTEEPIVHISLNPSPDDVLTDEQLRTIADEYMQKLGFGAQPYVIFKHEDIERRHVHIVTTNVMENGKKLDDSFIRRRSKAITNDIERKYHLHPADVRQNNKVWSPKKVDLMNGRIKYQIKNITKFILNNYKIETMNELKSALAYYNVDLQEVRGALDNGKIYTGLLYFATDDSGKHIANPIKSSHLGKDYGIGAIENSIAEKDKISNYNKQHTRKIISECMSQSKNKSEFENSMHERGIDIYFRKNEAGRIYGATIIDHNEKVVVNGSKVGKEFSANTFHSLFEQWEHGIFAQENSPAKEKEHTATKNIPATKVSDSDTTKILPSNDFGIDGSSKNESNNTVDADAILNAGLMAAGLLDALFAPPDAVPPSHYVPEKKGKKGKKKRSRKEYSRIR